jgi:hypothetical protein
MHMQAQREGKVWLVSIRNPALEEGGWSAPRFRRFTSGKRSVTIVQEAEWASGPI